MNVSSQTPGSALSKDQIRELVAPMEQRTRRYARRLAFLFLLSGALIAALVTLLAIHADNAVTTENIAPGVIVFLFFGVLAGVCARALVLSDLRWLPELIGKGRTLAGTIMSHRVVANGIHQIVVVWQEGDDEVGAHLDIDQLRDADKERHVTIVTSGRRQVGVVLNAQLYIALRNSPRFLRWKTQRAAK